MVIEDEITDYQILINLVVFEINVEIHCGMSNLGLTVLTRLLASTKNRIFFSILIEYSCLPQKLKPKLFKLKFVRHVV